MTDREWATKFIAGNFEGTGHRFNETVDVLVKKLGEARAEAAGIPILRCPICSFEGKESALIYHLSIDHALSLDDAEKKFREAVKA